MKKKIFLSFITTIFVGFFNISYAGMCPVGVLNNCSDALSSSQCQDSYMYDSNHVTHLCSWGTQTSGSATWTGCGMSNSTCSV